MNQHAIKLLLFLSGAAAAMTGSALIREAPGAKTYFVHQLAVGQAPNPDGGLSLVTATAYTTVSLTLGDGGVDVLDLGGVTCGPDVLTTGAKATLRNILNASSACAQNAP